MLFTWAIWGLAFLPFSCLAFTVPSWTRGISGSPSGGRSLATQPMLTPPSLRWSGYTVGPTPVTPSANGTLFFMNQASFDTSFGICSVRDGSVLWVNSTARSSGVKKQFVTFVREGGDEVLTSIESGELVDAMSLATGEPLWQWSFSELTGDLFFAAAITVDGRGDVYVTGTEADSNGGQISGCALAKIDGVKGTLVWWQRCDRGSVLPRVTEPVVVGDTIVYVSNNTVVAADTASGDTKWMQEMYVDGNGLLGTAALATDPTGRILVVTGSARPAIAAYSVSSGKMLWGLPDVPFVDDLSQVSVSPEHPPVVTVTGPAGAGSGDASFVGADREMERAVHAFSASNGTALWRFGTCHDFVTVTFAPADAAGKVPGGIAYVGCTSSDHTLTAVNPIDGSVVWKTKFENVPENNGGDSSSFEIWPRTLAVLPNGDILAGDAGWGYTALFSNRPAPPPPPCREGGSDLSFLALPPNDPYFAEFKDGQFNSNVTFNLCGEVRPSSTSVTAMSVVAADDYIIFGSVASMKIVRHGGTPLAKGDAFEFQFMWGVNTASVKVFCDPMFPRLPARRFKFDSRAVATPGFANLLHTCSGVCGL